MANIKDVAELAQVSPAVVSRVLSGDKALRVSEATRERVLSAARTLEYVPNHSAQALRTARANTVALLVPDVTSAVFADLAAGAEEEAKSRGLAVILGRGGRLEDDIQWIRRMIGEGRVDGVLFQPMDTVRADDLHELDSQSSPIVVINSVDQGPLSTIVLDDESGVRAAVAHLRSLGHRDIGLVGALEESMTGARRERGFRGAMTDAGLSAEDRWITHDGYTDAGGRAAARRLLGGASLPSALVVANVNAAMGLLAEFHASGLRVPADVSIVAIHDVWYADAIWPPITTVRMAMSTLGATAVTQLMDRDRSVRHTVIDSPAPVLVERESTAAPSR